MGGHARIPIYRSQNSVVSLPFTAFGGLIEVTFWEVSEAIFVNILPSETGYIFIPKTSSQSIVKMAAVLFLFLLSCAANSVLQHPSLVIPVRNTVSYVRIVERWYEIRRRSTLLLNRPFPILDS